MHWSHGHVLFQYDNKATAIRVPINKGVETFCDVCLRNNIDGIRYMCCGCGHDVCKACFDSPVPTDYDGTVYDHASRYEYIQAEMHKLTNSKDEKEEKKEATSVPTPDVAPPPTPLPGPRVYPNRHREGAR
jgi:hypothetical protein